MHDKKGKEEKGGGGGKKRGRVRLGAIIQEQINFVLQTHKSAKKRTAYRYTFLPCTRKKKRKKRKGEKASQPENAAFYSGS